MIARGPLGRTMSTLILVLALAGGTACGTDGGPADLAVDAVDVPGGDESPDGWQEEDTAQTDVPLCPGGLGCPCTLFEDCNTGLCVESLERFECASLCGMGEICPRAWGCKPITVGGETIYGCVPRNANICRPCRSDDDCLPFTGPDGQDWLCIDRGATGRFCGSPCARNDDCPDTPVMFQCAAVQKADGSQALQCVPQDGVCPCTAKFAQNHLLTECFVENAFGRCDGQRTCDAPCGALTPAAEACNGVDDDCNGDTDEGLASVPCQVTNEWGKCPGNAVCSGGHLDACLGPQAAVEACNGLDDNCDGTTDEGFPDTDDDGIADCLDPDIDGDGILNASDNCPTVGNSDQANNDSAEEAADARHGDACDDDDDNDGIPDVADKCRLVKNTDQGDADLDGIGDACDCDADGDGVGNPAPLDMAGAACPVPVPADNCRLARNADQVNTDHDSLGDACDCDVDGDGVMNNNPGCPAVTNPDNCRTVTNPGQEDQDLDGTGDACDCDIDDDDVGNYGPGCPMPTPDNCTFVGNPTQADTDLDGKGDACDCDIDADGVPNANPGCPACGGGGQPACDNCPSVANPGQEFTPGNAFGTACDPDWDGDGVLNPADNCPRTFNPDQADQELDTKGDACDCDIDGDGFGNPGIDVSGAACPVPAPLDNCPRIANPDQANMDHDGFGDICDCDIDGDGYGNRNLGCPDPPVNEDKCPQDPLRHATPCII